MPLISLKPLSRKTPKSGWKCRSSGALFPDDLSDQKKKLIQMLAVAVNSLGNLDMIVPAVRDLGRRHGGYGVTPAHYSTVGAALIWTLRHGLGEAFTPEVEAAWAETYGLLSGVMIDAQEMEEV